jgi:hypothetical protein
MNITDLKAKAYDLIAMREYAQAELMKVNEEIAKLSQPPVSADPIAEVESSKEEILDLE